MATLSSILAWKIPWTTEPGELQSMELQRVRQDLAMKQQQHLEMQRVHGVSGGSGYLYTNNNVMGRSLREIIALRLIPSLIHHQDDIFPLSDVCGGISLD